jgi:hypothetical protein
MTRRSILARASIGGLALIVVGCGTPSASVQAPAPVSNGQTAASQPNYSVQQHGGGGGTGSYCEQQYQNCLNAGWGGYWFFRNRRCRRQYYQCINYGGH